MPVTQRLLGRGALALVAALATVGCSGGPSSDDQTVCSSDIDCGFPGDVCFLGQCTNADEGLLTEVDLEIRPPEGSELLPQQLLAVDITLDDRILIDLKDAATYTGEVCEASAGADCNGMEGEPDPVPLAARLVAIPELSITGRRLAVIGNSTEGGSYALDLVRDATFGVRVYPDDDARAPYFVPTTWSTWLLGEGTQARDIALPADEQLVHVTGRVLAGEGSGAIGIDNLTVQVSEGGRRLSSIARTAQDGSFVLSLGENVGEGARLLIRPTEDNPGFPEVVIDGLAFAETPDLGDINLGDVLAPVTLTGTVTGNDGDSVAGASVYLRGDVGLGEVRRLLTTDETGAFQADLPPGAYDLVAVAPTTSTSAGMVISGDAITVSPGREPLDLVLSARVAADGAVVDATGVAVPGATVTLSRLGPPGGGTERVLDGASWQFQVTTGEGGAFSTRVDPGRYRLSCTPPEESGAPPWTLITDVFSGASTLDVNLPPAAILAGEIRLPDDSGAIGPGAEVRAFARLVGEDGQAIPLGSVRTDLDGRFNMRLPDLFSHGSTGPDPEPDPPVDAGPGGTDGGS